MRIEIKAILTASFFYNFAAGLFGPIYAIYVENIGGDILTAGAASSLFSFVIGILVLLFGLLEDNKLNKKAMLIIGYLIIAFGNIGYLFVSNTAHLFIIQIVNGVGLAVIIPSLDGIYSKNIDRGKESSEWAYWEGGTRIIYAAAALAGGFIASAYGFNALFIIMAGCAFASSFACAAFINKKHFKTKR